MTRRQRWRIWAALALLSWSLLACAATELAPGVYAQLGDNAAITPENDGDIANAGFIVTETGVIVVDTGISYHAGVALRRAIETDAGKPIATVVLTHPVQEFIFGAAAFQESGAPITMHRDAIALMQRRCNNCLRKLTNLLGSARMAGSRVITPDRTLADSMTLQIGGRDIDLISLGQASAPGDLVVFDRRSGTLFGGGVVFAQRLPNLRDGNIGHWIEALESLKSMPFRRIVPGIGPVCGVDCINAELAYLRALQAAVSEQYRAGASLIETINRVRLPEFSGVNQYEALHVQNVQYVYRQLEDADLRR